MSPTQNPSLDHPVLGSINGLITEDEAIVQYRGIPYATIPGRWRDSILLSERLSASVFDATHFGPCCPQAASGFAFDLSLVGQVKLADRQVQQCEFKCLNLTVSVPASKPQDKSGLPVAVWVHGGGFSVGSHSWPQYDLARIVALSSKIGKPIIGVSFNYRLGIFGFLASDEIEVKGNFGLKDQACAFRWIKQHIAGFGGDPQNIMAFGESAGAISISTLLVANEPLFSRCILMSGETTLRRIRTMKWQNFHYLENVRLLNLHKLSPLRRREKLLDMSVEELVSILPAFQHWSPALDGQYLCQTVDLGILSDPKDQVGKPSWCNEIAIGDAEHDGTILKSRFLDDPNAIGKVSKALDLLMCAEEKEKIMTSYKLTRITSIDGQWRGLLELVSNLRFYLPVLKVAEGWRYPERTECRRYHFHLINPVKGQFQGLASHELDVAFLLQNFREHLPDESIRVGEQMAEKWIHFAYGNIWGSENKVLVIGPGENMSLTSHIAYDEIYRHGRGTLMQQLGWEKCFQLGEILQGCYYPEF